MVYKDIDPISQVTVLEAQWTNLPEDVVEEIRNLWINNELGNDYSYYPWTADDFLAADDKTGEEYMFHYPRIAAYLRERGIEECLIHFWW